MESSSMSTRPQPTSTSTPTSFSTRRRTFFTPLSVHGMPKTPGGSSFRTHRFSTLRSPLLSPSPTMSSPPLTPMSPTVMSPMSPPMSAKSFGTFIESEPSTPAYSPRSGSSNWDSNTLLLLSPVSSAPSSPVSPTEPVWEMMTPIRKAKKPSSGKTRVWAKHSRTISISSSETPAKSTIPEEGQKENTPPSDGEKKDEKNEKVGSTHTVPLGKMARMKSLLRRKTVSEKKTEKPEKRRREYEDLDRMEDVHWTEM